MFFNPVFQELALLFKVSKQLMYHRAICANPVPQDQQGKKTKNEILSLFSSIKKVPP